MLFPGVQRHTHTVRGLKPLLFRCSTAALPAASQVSAYSIRTSDLTTAAAASRVLSSSPAESSSSVSDKSHWLVCLAAGAVTACVVGSSLEKAPVTERQQLLLGIYKSPPRSDPTTAMPMACALDGITAPKGTTARKDDDPLVLLNSHGDAVTEAAYVRVAKAVADLAAADPALQSRLASTPAKIQLGHYSFVLERSMGTSLSGKDDKPMPPFRNELAAAIRLAVPGGALLHQQTADEVITGLAKELAHVIANHDAESKSWSTMSCMVAAIPAALFPRRSLWSCMAASLVCWYFAKVVIIYTWLHRKHVYEADAIAAAISQAAGVSPSSVLTSMQRSYYAEATTPAKASLRLVRQQRMQWHLAKLQSLLPKSQIPAGPISDSVGMQLVIDAAASELSGASSQVQAECSKPIGILEDLLAEELCCLRHPYTAWTDIHPHWLDRIAHVENILRSASAPWAG